jgi:hypothetical protein
MQHAACYSAMCPALDRRSDLVLHVGTIVGTQDGQLESVPADHGSVLHSALFFYPSSPSVLCASMKPCPLCFKNEASIAKCMWPLLRNELRRRPVEAVLSGLTHRGSIIGPVEAVSSGLTRSGSIIGRVEAVSSGCAPVAAATRQSPVLAGALRVALPCVPPSTAASRTAAPAPSPNP